MSIGNQVHKFIDFIRYPSPKERKKNQLLPLRLG